MCPLIIRRRASAAFGHSMSTETSDNCTSSHSKLFLTLLWRFRAYLSVKFSLLYFFLFHGLLKNVSMGFYCIYTCCLFNDEASRAVGQACAMTCEGCTCLTDSHYHLCILWLPATSTHTALSRTRTETSHVTRRKGNACGTHELHTDELHNQTQGDTDFE